MFKVKNRNYYINEKLIKRLHKRNDTYFVLLVSGETLEIDVNEYIRLGGKL